MTLSVIVSTVFIALILISVAISTFFAYKRGLFRSLFRLGTFLGAVILSFAITLAVSHLAEKKLVNFILGKTSVPPEIGDVRITSVDALACAFPNASQYILGMIRACLALAIFLLVCFVLCIVTHIVYGALKNKFPPKNALAPKFSVLSCLIGAFIGFFSMALVLSPLAYVFDVISDVPRYSYESLDAKLVIDVPCGVPVKAVRGATALIYEPLTRYGAKGAKTTLSNDIETAVAITTSANAALNGESVNADALSATLRRSPSLKAIYVDVANTLAMQATNGAQDVFDLTSLVGVDSDSEFAGAFCDGLVCWLASASTDNFDADADLLANTFSFILEKKTSSDATGSSWQLDFNNTSDLSALLNPLLKNARHAPLVNGFVYSGVNAALSAIDVPQNTTRDIMSTFDPTRPIAPSVSSDERTDNVTLALSSLCTSVGNVSNDEANEPSALINAVGNALSLTVRADVLPTDVLCMISDAIFAALDEKIDGVNVADLASAVSSALKSDDPEREILRVSSAAAAGMNVATSIIDGKETDREDVENLIRDMTPELADSLRGTLNEQHLSNSGLDAQKSQNIDRITDSLLTHIAENRTLSEKEIENDALVIKYVLDAVNDKNEGGVFGDDTTPEEFAKAALASNSVCNTAKDLCQNDNGGISVDPCGISSAFSAEEKESLSDELHRSYGDPELKDNAVYLAALLLGEDWS